MIVEGESGLSLDDTASLHPRSFVGGENGHFVRLLTNPLFIPRIDGGHIVSA